MKNKRNVTMIKWKRQNDLRNIV